MAAFAAHTDRNPPPCMHAARSCSAAQILRAGNPARRICKPWRVAWHVALADGPARPVTIRYVMNTYDIAMISIHSIYTLPAQCFQHCAGQGLAGRPVRIRSLYVYVCELVYKLVSI